MLFIDSKYFQKFSVEDFRKELKKKNAVLLDVRTSAEFLSEHISGAKNIDVFDENFAMSVVDLNKSNMICICCNNGRRSSIAADYLRKKGFLMVCILKGGLENWKSKGYNLVSEL